MVSSATATDLSALGFVCMLEDEDEEDEGSLVVANAVGAGNDERVVPYPWNSPVTGAPNPVAAGVSAADTPNPIAGVVPAPNPNVAGAGATDPIVAAGALNPVELGVKAGEPKSPEVDDELPNPNSFHWPCTLPTP